MDTIRKWAESLLRSPLYAALFALACIFVPFGEIIAWGWLSLTALRFGVAYSVWVLLGIVAGEYATLGGFVGEWMVATTHIICFILPIWIFSLVLRYTVSLNFALQCVALSILVAVLIADIFQLITPETIAAFLRARLNPAVAANAMTDENIKEMADQFAIAWPTMFFWIYITGLFLGRWWQAALENPGGFQREFHTLRLNYWVGSVGLIVLLVSFWLPANMMVMAIKGLIGSLFLLAGLGFIHYFVAVKKWSVWVLVAVYAALIFLIPLVVILAAVDSVADLRKKISQ